MSSKTHSQLDKSKCRVVANHIKRISLFLALLLYHQDASAKISQTRRRQDGPMRARYQMHFKFVRVHLTALFHLETAPVFPLMVFGTRLVRAMTSTLTCPMSTQSCAKRDISPLTGKQQTMIVLARFSSLTSCSKRRIVTPSSSQSQKIHRRAPICSTMDVMR